MASCFRNICTKNYPTLIISFYITVENVGDVFLRHSVVNDILLLNAMAFSCCVLMPSVRYALNLLFFQRMTNSRTDRHVQIKAPHLAKSPNLEVFIKSRSLY